LRQATNVRLAAVCAVLLLAGCSSGGGAHDASGPLTKDELHWVRSYVGWKDDFDAVTFRGGKKAAREALAGCTSDLEERVDDPPTDRLEAVDRLARRACADYERYARLVHRFFDENDFSVSMQMSAASTHADEASDRTFARLRSLLRESRPLPSVTRASARSRLQPRYHEAAAQLTSRDFDVRCWNRSDWSRIQDESAAFQDVASVDVDGFANFYTGHVNLSPQVCSALDELTYSDERPTASDALDRLAYGAFVLAHETDHIVGVDDEAVATCDGAQNIDRVAQALGADAEYARKLADAYWEDLYPQEPSDYRTLACGPGRPLDRSPGDGRWP
jgi:hypothetical protein